MGKAKKRIRVILAAAAAAVCMAMFFSLKAETDKAKRYQTAVETENKGKAAEAFRLYSALGTFRDSHEKAARLAAQDPVLPCLSAGVGETVCYGTFEQDGDPRNGPEPIEWLVLERFEDRVLLLSLTCLQAGAYHDVSFAPVTWEESALRSWLNGPFYAEAFGEKEQTGILPVWNDNDDQRALGTEGGRDTLDRVFLLSQTEAGIYLKDEESRYVIGRCCPSAASAGAFVFSGEEETVPWWLRSPGVYEYSAQYVDPNGQVYESGAYTDIDYQFGIRPAIWIGLEETEEE